MDTAPPSPPSIDLEHARRERSPYLRSLARFVGLAALAATLSRTLLRTRARKLVAATIASAVLVGAGLALIVPSVRSVYQQPAQSVTTVTGSASGTVSSGGADVDLSKAFPRIYSTKLGIDVAIQPGDGKTPPVKPIAYQYPNTAPLGQAGNTYLYSHDRPGMFFGLHSAKVGDVLIVAMTATSKLYFQITEIHGNVAWNDLEWLQPSKDERVTLQTCNYSGDFDPRFVVVTRPIPADQGRALTNGA
jgi:sortase (surface protein transpeptidase)